MFSNMFSQPTYYHTSPFGFDSYYQAPQTTRRAPHYQQQQCRRPQQSTDFFSNFMGPSPWEVEEYEETQRRRQAAALQHQRRQQLARQQALRQRQREEQEYLRQLNMLRRGQHYYGYQPEQESESEAEDQAHYEAEVEQPKVQSMQVEAPIQEEESAEEYATASEDEPEDDIIPEVEESESEEEQEEEEPNNDAQIKSQLTHFQAKLDNSIATYTRINASSSSSSYSGSSDEDTASKTTTNSRVKVLQRTQLEFEKLYEQLDSLEIPKDDDLRRLKHKLTGQVVSYADKVDELRRELKKRMEAMQAREVPKRRKVTLEEVEDESSDY